MNEHGKLDPSPKRRLVEEYVRRFSIGDIRGVLDLFTGDCVFRMPLREEPIRGKPDLEQFFRSLRDAWLTLDERTKLILIEDDVAVAELEFTGTLADQQTFTASSVDIFWFTDGLIREVKVYTDTYPLRRIFT